MRAWLALALLAVVGCSFDSPEVQTIENSCANDVNCPTGVCELGDRPGIILWREHPRHRPPSDP